MLLLLLMLVLISVGVHYCVHRLQNNCEPLEMMGGYTIVSTGFWGIFFQFFCFLMFKLF